jgi:G patch domain/KOW motif-containing protein
MDVLSANQFSAVDPENPSQIFDDLREKDLETVMPKNDGDRIAVLKGDFKGEVGKLISRDRKKDQVVI